MDPANKRAGAIERPRFDAGRNRLCHLALP